MLSCWAVGPVLNCSALLAAELTLNLARCTYDPSPDSRACSIRAWLRLRPCDRRNPTSYAFVPLPAIFRICEHALDLPSNIVEFKIRTEMVLFFNNHSSWRATPGMYLEDLFIRPEESITGRFGPRVERRKEHEQDFRVDCCEVAQAKHQIPSLCWDGVNVRVGWDEG